MNVELVDAIRGFVSKELAPFAAITDRNAELQADLWKKLGEVGLAGLVVPERWGGAGADLPTVAAVIEEVGAGCASTAWVLLAHLCAVQGILVGGKDAVKERWLPELTRGAKVGAALVATEAGGGSNPLAMRARARRDGPGWVLDGAKQFITQAGVADSYLVLARTGEEPGPASLSCFLVERDDAGVTFGRREELLGLRGVAVGEVAFEACRLPEERLLGTAGGGMAVLGAVGGLGTVGASAAALGVARAAFDATVQHLRSREVAGQPLSAVGGVQAQVAELRLELAAARAWLSYGLSAPAPKGPPLDKWMAKIGATEAAQRVIDRALRLHGAAGYTRGLPLERALRDVRAFCIHWGNNEVLRDSLGKLG